MKRTIGTILFVIYAIIAITVTVLLLSYNEYNCSQIGGYTVYIVDDDSLEPEYEEGSILLIKETSDKHVQVGDEIFLYGVINSQEYEFVNTTLVNKTQQGRHVIYEVEDGVTYDSEYFVGKADGVIVIKGWGRLLEFLESKWGYLFCIVIVSLLLFLQEVFDLVIELKYGNAKGTKGKAKTETKTKTKTEPKAKTTTKPKTAPKANVVTETKPATEEKSTQTEVKEEVE